MVKQTLKYPFASSGPLLWKGCRKARDARDRRLKKFTLTGGKRPAPDSTKQQQQQQHHLQPVFDTSKINFSDTFRLPVDRDALGRFKVLSTQQQLAVEFIKNEIILSKCAGCVTGNVFHLGGLPGAGKTATISSLIEDLADANMTAKGAVMLCSKTNVAKTNMHTSCVDPQDDEGYMFESRFKTVNSGFCIPVISSSSDVEGRIEEYVSRLGRYYLENVCYTDMVVMDEYTMTNVNEILFIDCLMRASRGLPDVPFGGVPVIFLGDHRQNSAVVDKKNPGTSIEKGSSTLAIAAAATANTTNKDTIGGSTGRGGGVAINLVSEALLSVLETFLNGSEFNNIFIRGCHARRRSLEDRLIYVKDLIEERLNKKSKIVKTENDDDDDDAAYHPPPAKKSRTNVDAFNAANGNTSSALLNDDDEFEYMGCFDDEEMDRIMSEMEMVVTEPITHFSKNRVDKIMKLSGCSASNDTIGKTVKTTGYDVLREEALRAEIASIDRFLGQGREELVNRLADVVRSITKFANDAMREIIQTGRERLYILSAMTDVLPDCNVISLVNEEIVSIKSVFGKDPKCTDSINMLSKTGGDEETRINRLSDAIMNAFFRVGDELKEETPMAHTFKVNMRPLLDQLGDEKLKDADLFEIASDMASGKGYQQQQQLQQRHTAPDDEVSDDECWYANEDDDCDEEIIINRTDAPTEIDINDKTPDRVRKMISFSKEYYEIYRSYPILTRSRFWHVYLLTRDIIAKNVYSSKISSPFSRLSSSDSDLFHTSPYWLRALSLPINANEDTSNMQSAYAAHLSALSRTFIMSSQKRISVAHHTLGLMYSASLYNMTVNLSTIADMREITSNIPVGFANRFAPSDYTNSLFESIVREYLVINKSNINEEISEIQRSSEGYLDMNTVRETINNMNINIMRHSKAANCTYISSGLLVNIAKAKIYADASKEREKKAISTLLEKITRDKKTSEEGASTPSIMPSSSGPSDAVALVRGHQQKNIITDIVEKTLAIALKKAATTTNIQDTSRKFCVIFKVAGLDISYVSHSNLVKNQHRRQIMERLHWATNGRTPKIFIDRFIDMKLAAGKDARHFSRILIGLRESVTRATESIFFVGQSVVFTHSNPGNSGGASLYSCNVPFFTNDTGRIERFARVKDKTVIYVKIDRSKLVAPVSAGEKTWGVLHNGKYYGAAVTYFPITSSKAQTIYSSQGQTLWRDTFVDITGSSSQDAYVAITRNADVLNLKIMEASQTDMANLVNLRSTMGRDKAKMFPLGALRGTTAADSHMPVDDAVVFEQYALQTAVNDRRRDLVSLAQRFVMDMTSDNSMVFNAEWMSSTARVLVANNNGLEARLREIEEAFFVKITPRDVIDMINDRSNKTLMQLYNCVNRSVLHFCMTSKHIKTPAMSLFKAYTERSTPTLNNVKFHPAFINSTLKPETIDKLFFDVAPHSFVTKVFQFYAHFLFMVYEKMHICHTSFAFLPSASPVYNANATVAMEPEVQKVFESNVTVIPGGGLGYEPAEFASSKDGNIRERDRKLITHRDHKTDMLISKLFGLGEQERYKASSEADASKAMAELWKAQRYNLRREGKYCRQWEVGGLNTHGTIAVACDVDSLSEANVCVMDGDWASFSYEANLYGMLVFMTKLAAASGVTNNNIPGLAEKLTVDQLFGYGVRVSPEVLCCGQCKPALRLQFLMHFSKLNKSANKDDGVSRTNVDLFGGQGEMGEFEEAITNKRGIGGESIRVVIITETFGSNFSSYSTTDVRNSLLMGLGKIRVEEKKNLYEVGMVINKFLKKRQFNTISFFISADM